MTKIFILEPQKWLSGFLHVLCTINVTTYLDAFMHKKVIFVINIAHFAPVEIYYMHFKCILNGLVGVSWIED
jgi:hypothetical protein